jgi:hypothetical protein
MEVSLTLSQSAFYATLLFTITTERDCSKSKYG